MVTPVAMLTYNDVTVQNALEVFEKNKHTKCEYWGFKNTGIDFEKSAVLAKAMLDAGKKTAYECLCFTEDEMFTHAQFAIDHGFHLFLGMNFSKEVSDFCNENGVWYFPTFGRRDGPSKLKGTHDEIVESGLDALNQGAYGVRLSVYRYVDGDPEAMAAYVIPKIQDHGHMMITGSINSYERLDFLKNVEPWGFTMGSALFDDSFGEIDIAAKLDLVFDYMGR